MKHFLKTIALVWLVLTAGSVHSAEILVPGQQATLTAALGVATDGDTIRITNSANYDEGMLVIDKRINLVADVGQTPVVRATAVTDAVLQLNVAAAGSHIGSLDGGTITVDGNGQAAMGMRILATTTRTYFENLTVKGFTDTGEECSGAPAAVQHLFTKVVMDATGASNYGFRPTASEDVASSVTYSRC